VFERYTEAARRVVFFARYEASAVPRGFIDSGHLLLGLLREGRGIPGHILGRNGLTHDAVAREIAGSAEDAVPASTSVDIALAADARSALQHAGAEADEMGSRHIGTEHLLLGLMDEPECLAASILAGKGLRVEEVREEVRLALRVQEMPPRPKEALPKLVDFLARLQEKGAGYRVGPFHGEAIRVEVAAPGEVWVATFFIDGRVSVEVLTATGGVQDESALARLLEKLGPSDPPP
jgi:ATP-dependent Clp protease ATP-binding subunit ClpC